MHKKMVLTAIGPDRKGLVKDISSVIHKCGANLEDSRMAILAGDFALIILFSGSDEIVEQVQKGCRILENRLDFQISFKNATGGLIRRDSILYKFQATGVDQPGIVHVISAILTDFDTNVVSLESKLTNAAFHGTSIFTLQAEIQIDETSVLDRLSEALDKACNELDLSYDLDPVNNP